MERQKELIAALREGYAAARTEERKHSEERGSTVGDGID